MNVFEAVQVTDRVYWVGAINWAGRDFHGYATPRGSTYNAYLLMAGRITLIDTVRAPFFDEMMARIASVIDPHKIDIIVSNHSEPDHSGALGKTIGRVKPSEVFASVKGREALAAHYALPQEVTAVQDGETLDLGDATLTFLETRMLHWPDSMMSYLAAGRLLFSQDAFGMHLASAERFADELDAELLNCEAGKYYANILLPYSALVAKLLDRVASMGIEIDVIAPDHGPVFRRKEDVGGILASYARWAQQKPAMKAVILYDTMWHSTELMARAVAEGLGEGGAHPIILNARKDDRSTVAAELLDAGALIAGSPTLNNGIFPSMADVMTYLKGLRPRNLLGAAFGSYGWSGESVKLLNEWLDEMKTGRITDGVKVNYAPTPEDLLACRALGRQVADALKDRCQASD